LSKSKSLKVVFLGDPTSLVNKVLLHVTREGNRATESYGSEPQEVSDKSW
jgi:hypothetical protein